MRWISTILIIPVGAQVIGGEIAELYSDLRRSGATPRRSVPSRSHDEVDSTDHGITEIGLERTSCFGTCPVYTVFIHSDGYFRYEGSAHVERVGRQTGRISRVRFRQLAQFINDSGYTELGDDYARGVTDNPTVYTTVVRKGRRKVIRNYANAGPTKLWAIEQIIDKLLLEAKWDEDPVERISASQADDEKLKNLLKNPSKLRRLVLHSSPVTDAGLVHLEPLKHLEELDLSRTHVTDRGLVYLRGMTRLRALELYGTEVTDAGLAHLERLTELRELNLSETRMTDDGLRHIERLTRLEKLSLGRTAVTGAGLRHLRGLSHLQHLYLAETGVSDAGLQHLQGLTRLREIWLTKTEVTREAVEGLRAALPGLNVRGP